MDLPPVRCWPDDERRSLARPGRQYAGDQGYDSEVAGNANPT